MRTRCPQMPCHNAQDAARLGVITRPRHGDAAHDLVPAARSMRRASPAHAKMRVAAIPPRLSLKAAPICSCSMQLTFNRE